MKRRYKGIYFEFEKWDIFRKCVRNLPVVHKNKIYENEDDIYVFGSDEIWNISREKFLKSPEFWGIGLKKGRRISYAPSVNTATKEQYEQHKHLIEVLKDFDSISVRDEYSRDILNKMINCQIDIVLDPTFLYGINNFKYIEKKVKEKNSYVLIYTYGKMCKNPEHIKYIINAAKKRNWKIISVGKYLEWADKSINTTPEGFLGYVDSAQYVITDTFHGTVFSILYRKNFAEINPANKIQSLLNLFELESCVIPDTSQLDELMNKEIDYSKTEKIQKKYTEISKNYLKDALKKQKGT